MKDTKKWQHWMESTVGRKNLFALPYGLDKNTDPPGGWDWENHDDDFPEAPFTAPKIRKFWKIIPGER